MFSITIKLMKKSARMLIPAGIAILIGTAFIAATFLFSNSMDDSLRRQSTAQLGEANYIATMKTNSNGAVSENGSADRTTVADFNLDRIRATKGVKGARVDTSVSVSISAAGKRSNGYAVGTSTDRKLLPVRIVSGDQPVDNNEVALPKSVAKQLGVGVGDKVDVAPISNGSALSGTAVRDVRVVGLTSDPFGVYSFYGGASVLSENVVAAVYGVDDFDHMQAYMLLLDIDEADAAAAQRTVDEVSGLLPKSYGVESRRSVEAEAVRDLSSNNTSFPTIFLLSFGVLALFVAALVIANTFQVLVAQRRRTLALLRTIGAKKGQLYTSVLMEAGLLGLIASVLGVGFGIGLIALVTNTGVMEMMGMQARLILSWQAFVVPIAFGLIMTVLASLGSARSATSVTPLEALRPIELTDTSRAGKVRATIGVLTIIAGLALAGVAVWQLSGMLNGLDTMASDNYSSVLLMSIGGAALVFLGLVLTATFWLPVLMRLLCHHRHRCSQRQADHGGGARVPVQCRHDRHRRRPEDQRSQGSGPGQGRRGHHVRAHGDGDRGRRERGNDVPAARRRQEHLRTRRRHARRPERRHRRRRHRAAAEIPCHLRQGDHIRLRCEAAVHRCGIEWHCGKHRTRRVRQRKLDERRRFLINASQAGAIRLPPRLVQL